MRFGKFEKMNFIFIIFSIVVSVVLTNLMANFTFDQQKHINILENIQKYESKVEI